MLVRSPSYPESISQAIARLGWSATEFATRLGLSTPYIQQTLEGKPLPEVQQRIFTVLVDGFADEAVASIKRPDSEFNIKARMRKVFVRVVRRRELSLQGIADLSDRAKKSRVALAESRKPLAVDDVQAWEGALEGLLEAQPQLPRTDTELDNTAPFAFERSMQPNPVHPDPCPNCHVPIWQQNLARCPRCGYGLDPNWN